jgi:ABC-2 type transport system ATP-binding protein
MAFLSVEDVEKEFDSVSALDGVDLSVGEGEIVGVLGPNGAGKSTLVKILTGQLEADSGSVEVLDLDPSRESVELKKRVGVLPEREDPPSFLTGSEYFELVSDVRGVDIDKDEWVRRLGLDGEMSSLTSDLSKGERQKLMIAQAFFHEPQLVFVDEPLVNLDPIVQEEVKDIFKSHRDDGGTVFLCTHIVSLAEELCDRVFFVRDGEVVDEIENVENLKAKFLEEQ